MRQRIDKRDLRFSSIKVRGSRRHFALLYQAVRHSLRIEAELYISIIECMALFNSDRDQRVPEHAFRRQR